MEKPARYRKKPVVIEAIQFTGDNHLQIVEFMGLAYRQSPMGTRIIISTLEGEMTAQARDFIIKGVAGEFYPCKADIFHETYEAVDGEPPAPAPQHPAAGTQKPTVGRMVHYVAYGTPGGEFQPAHRAAVVTEVKELPAEPGGSRKALCRLCVLNPTGIFFTDWLYEDPTGKRGGTWHWPERE